MSGVAGARRRRIELRLAAVPQIGHQPGPFSAENGNEQQDHRDREYGYPAQTARLFHGGQVRLGQALALRLPVCLVLVRRRADGPVVIDGAILSVQNELQDRVRVSLAGTGPHLHREQRHRQEQCGACDRERPRGNRQGGSGSDALATTYAIGHAFTGTDTSVPRRCYHSRGPGHRISRLALS